MTTFGLIRRSLLHYWRTNLAVIAGVGVAVSVLSGALLVGDSVRGSLKELFLGRLGRTSYVLAATHFFGEDLPRRMEDYPGFQMRFQVCPLVVVQGIVTHQETRRRASGVQVYGVDDRFWRFHHHPVDAPFSQRDALVSSPLAAEIGIQSGDSILLRLEAPSDIPAESLHGKKENRGRTVRFTARRVLAGRLGEFSLNAEQQSVKAIFVPMLRLQKELGQEGQINSVLLAENASSKEDSSQTATEVSNELERVVRESVTLEQMGIRLRRLRIPATQPDGPNVECLSLEKTSTLLDESLAEKAREAAASCGLSPLPIVTYLANRIKIGVHETPYSLVAAVEPEVVMLLVHQEATQTMPPIWLNQWTADDLNAKVGDTVTLEYYLWREKGELATQVSEFELAGILPIRGIAADRNLVPDYPGISDSETLSDWDPPFPMDLSLVRPKDEAYWKQYRATPKAFIRLSDGEKIWRSRFGLLTSIRFFPSNGENSDLSSSLTKFREALQARLSPFTTGFALIPVRAQGLAASRGATDFGEYFAYFSFFLLASAILLATLFFRLGVEQRLKEVGLLRALGFCPKQLRGLFLGEGLILAGFGSLAGVGGAVAYASLMILLLRTWWIGAVGTTELGLHISTYSLLAGAAAGILSAAGCIAWTIRRLMPASTRGLLAGVWLSVAPKQSRPGERLAFFLRKASTSLTAEKAGRSHPQTLRPIKVGVVAFSLTGSILLAAAAGARLNEAAGFFGAAISFLLSLLCLQSLLLHRTAASRHGAPKRATLWRLGVRQASDRPGRSVLCIALIASAAFIIVAVDGFRRERPAVAHRSSSQPLQITASGTGGYALVAQSLLPIFQNLNVPEGRAAVGFSEQDSELWNRSAVVRFRVRPGEDASCLNLFEPTKPRILAPERGYPPEGRFGFKESLAGDNEEQRNPWRLLDRSFPDGAVPVIGDANSLTYVLHRKVGEDWLLDRGDREALRLRVVAALDDSLFQRELLMSEDNFKRLFPAQQGYRFFLFDVPKDQSAALSQLLEDRLADEGLDVESADDRLAGFHRVENTYLSTFQFLGGLGLLLGTLGLAVVILRNVLERRRELALLRAVGYTPRDLRIIVLAENVFLLVRGVATGIVCAVLAILPAMVSRGWNLGSVSLEWLLLAVVAAGLMASLLATRAALRTPLLASLRSE